MTVVRLKSSCAPPSCEEAVSRNSRNTAAIPITIQFEQWDPLDTIGSLQLAISLDDCWQIGTRNPSDNNCDWDQLFSRSASAVRMA
jgi:hypothetical protein